jgi:hypothetical protein
VLVLILTLTQPILLVPYYAEIIDRLVAVANNKIITLGDVEKEEKFYQLDSSQAGSLSRSTEEKNVIRAEVVAKLIEKALMSEQILEFPGSQITPDEIETQLKALRQKSPHEEAWNQLLADLHISQNDLIEHLRWQILVLKYVENRFRQFTVVEPGEIDAYYQKSLIPELERKGIRPYPEKSDVEQKIREILTEDKVNQAIEEWLASLKATANIAIFD